MEGASLESARRQSRVQSEVDPVQRFFELLSSAITAGRAHVANEDGRAPATPQAPKMPAGLGWEYVSNQWDSYWKPHGDLVGWVVGSDLYLDQDAAYRAAQGMATTDGTGVRVQVQTLTKRLHQRGVLLSTGLPHRLQVHRVLQGRRRYVVHVSLDRLSGSKTSNVAINGDRVGL